MRRARSLLVGSLPLLAALPLAIATEVPLVPRGADPGRSSQGSEVVLSTPLTLPIGLALEARPQLGGVSTAGEAPEDCWIVEQWIDTSHGPPQLCTKWLCDSGRSWTECVPI